MAGVYPVAMPRAQVGIERLPSRRMGTEPRESMNCKSCRKRKIKCNRLRPSCEACQVFQCPCIYDAVPKKRGPKTDVLEALLKRVDGLEAKLKEKNSESPTTASTPDSRDGSLPEGATGAELDNNERQPKRLAVDTTDRVAEGNEPVMFSPIPGRPASPAQAEALLDTYFTRFHAKPYYILDESSVRQRLQLNQLPGFLVHAIYAVSSRFTLDPSGYRAAVRSSEEHASLSRRQLDIDEPSVDALQALLLLVLAFTAAGKGKKAYMLMTSAVGMAMALEIHREIDVHARITPVERDVRRRLFWTCYLLDRFLACGSKRPALIADKAILLRLPCWSPSQSSLPVEGEFFNSGSNLQYLVGSGKKFQGGTGLLIDIARILDITNRYLAAGGVKGDSHFPWHSLSNLSKIRQDLDTWASGTDDLFSNPTALFGQADSSVLVLSKLIYHVIHCLIYRPFLPIDLSELAGTGQHQSWQIEATNLCFLHANAIAELIELGKQAGTIEWPEFVGYCICTAGTVHIHGAHYHKSGVRSGMEVFSSSADHLSMEMQQLSELRYAWASVQHQREILQSMCGAHSELVKSVAAGGAMGYSTAFQLEDFFDRYSNIGGVEGHSFSFDAANLSLSDATVDFMADAYNGNDVFAPRTEVNEGPVHRTALKRKNTAPSERPRPNLAMEFMQGQVNGARARGVSFSAMPPPPSPMMATPTSMNGMEAHMGRMEHHPGDHHHNNNNMGSPAGFGMTPNQTASPVSPMAGNAHFGGSPAYAYPPPTPAHPRVGGHGQGTYESMFEDMEPNGFNATAWQGEEMRAAQQDGGVAMSTSDAGSAEEKDPFLSLLEQLAENEGRQGGGQGMEFDFFGGAEGHPR
ncbi:related to nitrate assimilation regulatory protein nirA [Cephalotrichum gorgonifer]|uniref:Related to nitrate assimilation regulatory protein nirA n=1 Tax=Cephalotrichum gorgonifer TaxID=2041049 RepID=A0AAE8N5F2_9PEZI|nr:related to nitrate assimilation regulatory protein nirA [Cephalotrichum gorgonifer]